MLDEYIFGRATRISQEAPVMVVRQNRTSAVPGGAANVAKNLMALGASTAVVGVIGDDPAGVTLSAALREFGASDVRLVTDPGRPTTRKTRVLADAAHQVLRIDHEDHSPVSARIEEDLFKSVEQSLPSVDAVLLSDYQKGAVTEGLVSATIAACNSRGLPVIANAKPKSLPWYRGATLVSLNQPEAAAALGWQELNEERERGDSPVATAQKAAVRLREEFAIGHILVTLGGEGMCTEAGWTPPYKVDVFDTAGAGDTTIATVALGLATVGFRPEVFALAARMAASVVRKVGVAVPTPADLAEIRGLA
jgi:rfaE bifunctional protein kinase chain/domain